MTNSPIMPLKIRYRCVLRSLSHGSGEMEFTKKQDEEWYMNRNVGKLTFRNMYQLRLLLFPIKCRAQSITKPYLYNFDPLKPLFYKVKHSKTAVYGVYIIFLISVQKHRLLVLTSTHNLYFEQKYENIIIFIWKLSVFGGEIFNIFE